MEEWKFIEGYEGLYEVSNLGQVKNYHNNLVLKPDVQKNGYLRVVLYKDKVRKRYLLHRLVASTFIPRDDYDELHIDHINRVKTDNSVSNLRWVTHQENQFNKSIASNNTSGHTGIYHDKRYNRYIVRLGLDNQKVYGGSFINLEDAIKRCDELKEQYHSIGVNSK